MRPCRLVLLLALAAPATAAAQSEPHLVADVNQAPSSYPIAIWERMFAYRGAAYFIVYRELYDYAKSLELWRTNGSDETTLIAHLGPLFAFDNFARAQPIVEENRLLFVVSEPPALTTPHNGRYHLWTSDGTTRGTRRFASYGPASVAPPNPSEIATAGGKAVFARGGDDGVEPWVADMATGAMEELEDIAPGADGSTPRAFVSIGSRVLFIADDGLRGHVYATDGTPGATDVLAEVPAFAPLVHLGDLDGLAVIGTRGILTTDGTAAGTSTVSDVVVDAAGHTRFDGKIVFAGRDVPGPMQLFVMTSADRVDGVDAIPGVAPLPGMRFAVSEGRVFFFADRGNETLLWTTDLVTTSSVGPVTNPRELTAVPGGVVFYDDGLSFSDGSAIERSTYQLRDPTPIAGGAVGIAPSSKIVRLDRARATEVFDLERYQTAGGAAQGIAYDGRLVFLSGPRRTSGTPVLATTRDANGVTELFSDPLLTPIALTTAGGIPVLAALAETGGGDWETHRLDGAGESLVHAGTMDPSWQLPLTFVRSETRVFLQAGKEVWITDGTADGSRVITRAQRVVGAADADAGRSTYLVGEDAVLVTDGTPAGTTEIPDAHVGYAGTWAVAGERLFVVDENNQLVSTDGGPPIVEDLVVYPFLGVIGDRVVYGRAAEHQLVVREPGGAKRVLADGIAPWGSTAVLVQGRLLFAASSLEEGVELRATDGETVETIDLRPGPESSTPTSLTVVDGTALFFADDGITGREIYTSQGTARSTLRLYDAAPGSDGIAAEVVASRFVRAGDWVYFLGYDIAAGFEPFAFPASAIACTCRDERCCDACAPRPPGTSCGAAACGGESTCNGRGVCVAAPAPEIDDGLECTVDRCDEPSQAIIHVPIDGLCRSDDPCLAGTCSATEGCVFVRAEACGGDLAAGEEGCGCRVATRRTPAAALAALVLLLAVRRRRR